MGTCTNNKNKMQLEYIHQILASDIPRNLPPDYTELKGIPLQCGTIINDFILFQLKRKKIKQQLNELQDELGIIFKRQFKEKYYPFVRYKNYYTEKFETLLDNFFKDKEGESYEVPNELRFLPDFNKLKTILRDHYIKSIMNNQIIFYQKLLEYIRSTMPKKETTIKPKQFVPPTIKNFFSSIKTSIDKDLVKLTESDESIDEDRRIIENDIDNLYEICLDLPYDKVPMKLTNYPIEKNSVLLRMIMNEFLLGEVYIKGDIRAFVSKFYFNYIMKKYHYLSKTDSFYIIDYYYLNSCYKRYHPSLDEDSTDDEQISLSGITPDGESPGLFIDFDEKCSNIKLLYDGEYDNSTYLFGGFGTLLDVEENTCYEGMFRYGKRHGIGIFWEEDEKNKIFSYYAGEWKKDKRNGCGINIVISVVSNNIVNKEDLDMLNKQKIEITVEYKKGTFVNNKFITGIIQTYTSITMLNPEGEQQETFKKKKNKTQEKVIVFVYTKYQGEIDPLNDKYTGHGLYKKREYSYNEQKNIIEIESDYDYTGDFVNGFEDGQGVLKYYNLSERYNSEYKGGFSQGKINGYGRITYSENFFIKQYEGFFKDNMKFYLYGRVEFRSGDIYEGFFDDKFQKDYIGLYQHCPKVKKDENSKEKEKIPEVKLPVWKYDNYFGYFNKDKKHGLGRFISTVSMKSLRGSYVNGEKQACFQLTSEDDMAKEKVVDDFFSYDLNSSEIEMNIINLATRKKTSVVSDTSFRKKEQLSKKVILDDKKPLIKQKKMYFFFENNEILDKSERPFDIF